MEQVIKDVNKYLRKCIAEEITQQSDWVGTKSLPPGLRGAYEFKTGFLLGQLRLWIHPKGPTPPTPAKLRKQFDLILAKWKADAVFVLDSVSALQRARLIEQRIPFIVPSTQMYLPHMGVALSEYYKQPDSGQAEISPATQAVFIWLLCRRMTEVSVADVTSELDYSQPTVHKAFRELSAHDCFALDHEGRGRGNETKLQRVDSVETCWRDVLPMLRSPVQKRVVLKADSINTLPTAIAGISALAQLSMLAEQRLPTVAMAASKLQVDELEVMLPEDAGALDLELWLYDPLPCAMDGIVDRFSLYLSLQSDEDERTQMALEEMMRGITW